MTDIKRPRALLANTEVQAIIMGALYEPHGRQFCEALDAVPTILDRLEEAERLLRYARASIAWDMVCHGEAPEDEMDKHAPHIDRTGGGQWLNRYPDGDWPEAIDNWLAAGAKETIGP